MPFGWNRFHQHFVFVLTIKHVCCNGCHLSVSQKSFHHRKLLFNEVVRCALFICVSWEVQLNVFSKEMFKQFTSKALCSWIHNFKVISVGAHCTFICPRICQETFEASSSNLADALSWDSARVSTAALMTALEALCSFAVLL